MFYSSGVFKPLGARRKKAAKKGSKKKGRQVQQEVAAPEGYLEWCPPILCLPVSGMSDLREFCLSYPYFVICYLIGIFWFTDSPGFDIEAEKERDESDQGTLDFFRPPFQQGLPFYKPVKTYKLVVDSAMQTEPIRSKPMAGGNPLSTEKWKELKASWERFGVDAGFLVEEDSAQKGKGRIPPVRPTRHTRKSIPLIPPSTDPSPQFQPSSSASPAQVPAAEEPVDPSLPRDEPASMEEEEDEVLRVPSPPPIERKAAPVSRPEAPQPSAAAAPAQDPAGVAQDSPHWRPSVVVGERDTKCPLCLKKCPTVEALQMHIKVHTGEASFKCQECGRCFNEHFKLKRHLKTHLPEEEKLECQACRKKFAHRKTLAAHAKFCAAGGKRLTVVGSCDTPGCTAQFTNLGALKQHQKVCLAPEKQFACSFPGCQKRYSYYRDLTKHQRMYHSGV